MDDTNHEHGWKPVSLADYDLKKAYLIAERSGVNIMYKICVSGKKGLFPVGSPGNHKTIGHCSRPEYAQLICKALQTYETN